MAKKIVRGITDIKTINSQGFDTNNVNDLLSDGEHTYIHRKKKDGTEEYHNLTNNIKTIKSTNSYLKVTNDNDGNTATLTVSIPNIEDVTKCNVTMGGNVTSIKPPYDDLDTLPLNSEVTYSTLSGVKHLPTPNLGGCTVLTFSTQRDNTLGTSQHLITPEGEQFFRLNWFYSGTKKWSEWSRVKVENEYEYGLELFKNIAVIGDSYSSGELYVNENFTDYYDISWIQLLARRHGLQATNYSKGGLTAKTWLTDGKGKTKMDADTAKDLYFVYLGINDSLNMTSYTDGIGTKEDIGSEKDSFYAKYSAIITDIKTKAPNAKIAIINMHNSTKDVFGPINEIAKHFSLPVLTLANDYSLIKSSYTSEMNQGHPQALGYARLAGAIERAMSESFIKNKSYWMSYVPASND